MAMGVRSAVLASLQIWSVCYEFMDAPVKRMRSLGTLLRYGMVNGMGRTRRTTMKVEELVAQWVESLVGMCNAHDKDTYDSHDAKADELLGPLLAAPVKQVREFYAKLLAALKADKRVPMLVWLGFEAWGETLVKDAPDEQVKRLKNKLAAEIADLVEDDVADQVPKAIARALRWRDPETLKVVKDKLEGGAKPRLVGKESCLFMEIGRGKKKVQVML